MNSLLVKNATLIDPATNTERKMDLRIAGGAITQVGESLDVHESTIFDAGGMLLVPGFIDLHCHLRDFGQSDKETIESGTQAAAVGGFTTVVAMANTDPPLDNTLMLGEMMYRIAEHSVIDVLPCACVTKGMAGAELTNMVDLAENGAIAFSDDGMPISNLAILRRALEYARLANRVIISHAEDKDLSHGASVHESAASIRLGLRGYPSAAESACVAREIEVVRDTKGRLHFAHISTAASVDLIRAARRSGLPVSADVTPHHLCLTVDDIVDYDTNYKMNPPLRTREDQDALLQALADGTISAIGTDHAPHTDYEKSMPFDSAPFGVIGLETAFSLTYEKLVLSKRMNRSQYFSLLTTNPAKILDLPEPSLLTIGAPANFVVIAPDLKWTYDAKRSISRSHNSPFDGRQLTGQVVLTVARGRTVFIDTKHAALAS
jgi:dihydroorotase